MTNTPVDPREPWFPSALTRSPGWERLPRSPVDPGYPSGYLHVDPDHAGNDVATSVDLTGIASRVIIDLDDEGNLVGIELIA